MYISEICYMQNFNILSSLCSCAEWIKSKMAINPEDRYSLDKVHLMVIRAVTCDFHQYGTLTSVDSDEPVQPPFKL